MIWLIESPEIRMHNLRHELARWLKIARREPINRLEAEDNLRELVALCPEEILGAADKLKHDVCNQLTKLHSRAQLLLRGIDPKIRINALKVARNVN